jgi:hypothetical protein
MNRPPTHARLRAISRELDEIERREADNQKRAKKRSNTRAKTPATAEGWRQLAAKAAERMALGSVDQLDPTKAATVCLAALAMAAECDRPEAQGDEAEVNLLETKP